MHNPLNPQAQSDSELDQGLAQEARARLLETRIAAVLEQAPDVAIPQDFALRVAAQVPAVPARHIAPRLYSAAVPTTRVGWIAAIGSLFVLLAAMLLLAPHATGPATFPIALEWILCAQFCALAAWLGMRASAREN